MQRPHSAERWLAAGLFLTTLTTLLVELLDARLLSVLTWYHLSFLAVSLAMLGTASGAVLVFLAGAGAQGERARALLWHAALALALLIPATHAILIRSRIPAIDVVDFESVWPIARVTLMLTIPFLVSGAVVAIALTRCGGRIGVLYGFDLLGAATGCLLLVPLLQSLDMMSAQLFSGGLAAAGAFCFARFAGSRASGGVALVALLLFGGAALHFGMGHPIGVAYARGRPIDRAQIARVDWNAHSHVSVSKIARDQAPFYWGRGESPNDLRVTFAYMLIDGEAGTVITRWDGDPASLAWIQYDVTSLPYHLRTGDVGIIGAGGGRDILSAIWSGATSITAVELNDIFLDVLEVSHRKFAGIADRPEVRLVHDEARSWFTRSDAKLDVLQMSLIDTWAATGAGAFTLSENALYTLEGWRVFLDRLKPDGILSTSRWFAPGDASETSRLVSLCVAALIERGVERPADHFALVTRGHVATLLVSPSPFSRADLAKLDEVVERYDFRLLAGPGTPPPSVRLRRIVESPDLEGLRAATAHPDLDYSPPTDDRPYFFNMLKPGSFRRIRDMPRAEATTGEGGVIWGNIRATVTLMSLLLVSLVLVVVIVFGPLVATGLPRMRAATFLWGLLYFAGIGYGFMSLQIPFLQRFSVYVGHPVYTYSVILFTMILFAGLGSWLSDRLELSTGRWHQLVPVTIAAAIGLLILTLQPVLDATIGASLPARCAVVVALVAPLSTLLGFCFPIGQRLIGEISADALPWMWGINGAFGVLASILAVLVSMWLGIQANLWIAASAYLLVVLPATALAREAHG